MRVTNTRGRQTAALQALSSLYFGVFVLCLLIAFALKIFHHHFAKLVHAICHVQQLYQVINSCSCDVPSRTPSHWHCPQRMARPFSLLQGPQLRRKMIHVIPATGYCSYRNISLGFSKYTWPTFTSSYYFLQDREG